MPVRRISAGAECIAAESATKRVHINIAIADIDRSVGFSTTLFGTGPTVLKEDYAKWMLEDPRLAHIPTGAAAARRSNQGDSGSLNFNRNTP